jgi:hypothetical protein
MPVVLALHLWGETKMPNIGVVGSQLELYTFLSLGSLFAVLG